ncbi:MAG: hypothetical protein J3K34DRAFT_468631 [Monoraphidium minutum]|nr:MAG: hypothetical protein J3K34DRAFT_468631 [Monoraphidium minutum]
MSPRSLFVAAIAALMVAHASAAAAPCMVPVFGLQNTTAVMEGAKAVLGGMLTAVMRYRPAVCPGGKAASSCSLDGCGGQCKGANQICVPDLCGTCKSKCVNITVPRVAVKVPALPAFSLATPDFSLPKPPCAVNEVINATAMTTPLFKKDPRVACKPCPAGAVALPGALACTVCPPGHAANAATGRCGVCPPGAFNNAAGSVQCKPCPIGSFMPLAGAFGCVKCPLGFAAPKVGAASCDYVGFASS